MKQLDPKLVALLDSLRHRIRRYVVLDSLLAILVVVLGAFWLGLAIDFLPVKLGGTEMPRSARSVLLVSVGVVLLAIVATLLIGRLVRPLPDDSLALLVERHHPQLGGRLVTAVQLCRDGRQGDAHASALLRRVHAEAAELIRRVDPDRLFRWEPLARKAAVAGPLLLSVVVLAILSPDTLGHAAGRLTLLTDAPWPRRADLEMVGVELPVVSASDEASEAIESMTFDDRTLQLPRGSNPTLRIRARAEGAVVPTVCTMHYRTADGTYGQSNMRRVGRVVDGYQSFILDGSPLSGLSESMTIDIRGLDDRLEGYRIEAVPPPAITDMTVRMRYPDYLRLAGSGMFDLETGYRAGLRVREGSDVTLVASGSQPLAAIDIFLQTADGKPQPPEIRYSEDRTQARLTLEDVSRATTIRMVPEDEQGISAQAPFRYFLGVVQDEPPEVDLRLEGIGSAVTPVARIPVKTTADDDYGVDGLSVTVARSQPEQSGAGETREETSAGPAADENDAFTRSLERSRDGEAETVLDLRDLVDRGTLAAIQPGGAVSVFGEATDAYNLDGTHVTRSQVLRLEVVTPGQLLALMERRELAMRARLEQTIDEVTRLRESLDRVRRDGFGDEESEVGDEAMRRRQVRRLRIQQARLQTEKTSEELSGIAASLSDLLEEMVNNRVDSVDRRERIGRGVRDPLRGVVEGPLERLVTQIAEVEASLEDPQVAAERTAASVETAEEVLLALTAILEKMLDLESYNEILDLVRGLLDDQEKLMEETKEEQKQRVLDLFQGGSE